MKYTPDYFIKKFEAIPDRKWIAGNFVDEHDPTKHCVLGHLGVRTRHNTPEADALRSLFCGIGEIAMSVNDGGYPRFKQPTPKQRIMAALHSIKAKQCYQPYAAYAANRSHQPAKNMCVLVAPQS